MFLFEDEANKVTLFVSSSHKNFIFGTCMQEIKPPASFSNSSFPFSSVYLKITEKTPTDVPVWKRS